MRSVLALLLFASVAVAGPVPRPALPDPLGRGYMGIYPIGDQAAVSEVEANTPAARAGLRPGDVFVKVGPVEPKSFAHIVEYVKGLRPGTLIRIVVRRGSQEVPITLRLMARTPGT